MPHYTHDCQQCVFLREYTAPDGEVYDLYFHPSETVSKTIIARYGNEGWEYESGLGIGEELSRRKLFAEPLSVALETARNMGLLP